MIIKFVKIVWVPPGCKKHPTGDSSSTQFYWKITFLPKRAYFDFKKTCFFVFLGCGIVRFIRVTFLSNPSIPTSREIQLPLQKGDRKHTHLFKAPLIKGEGGDLSHKWELPLLHPPWERGGKGGIWATSGNCHCFTPLEKGGKKGGFEPQVGIAIASQPPLRKGEKGGIWTTSGNCHCFTTPLEKGGKKGGFEPQVEKGGIWPQMGKGRIYLQNKIHLTNIEKYLRYLWSLSLEY